MAFGCLLMQMIFPTADVGKRFRRLGTPLPCTMLCRIRMAFSAFIVLDFPPPTPRGVRPSGG